jgi:putative ABC transport system ATP-binding protein
VTNEHKRTVLIVTHNSTIARIADRVLRLRDGEIIGDDVQASPASPMDLDW